MVEIQISSRYDTTGSASGLAATGKPFATVKERMVDKRQIRRMRH